jgi:hypothetical protein
MTSVRQLAACLGLPKTFRIVHDFFGYASPPPWPNAPGQMNLPKSLSLRKQAKLVQRPHFNLHIVRVGTNDQGRFPQPVHEQQVDCAVQLARNIYAEIAVGIAKVDRWWCIPLSDATGYDVIDDDCEADELIDAYDLPEDGIIVFFVPAWQYTDPDSRTVGRTDGDDDGSVVLLQENNFVGTGRALAHELGHMFHFGHENNDPLNLMCQGGTAKTVLGLKDDYVIPATTHFYDWQAEAVRQTRTTNPGIVEWVYDAC